MTDPTTQETSAFTEVNGVRIHYHHIDRTDAGATLVLVHGGGPGANSWSSFKQNVPELARHHRLLLLDLPGYGRSDVTSIEGPMFSYYAMVVRDFLDAMGVEKASFVGNSLGAGVSYKVALEFPDRVDRLVLIAPAGASLPIFSRPGLPPEDIRLAAELYANPCVETMMAFLRKMTVEDVVTQDVAEERLEILSLQGSERSKLLKLVEEAGRTGKNTLTANHMEELWRDAERVPHSTLLVWGRDDRVVALDGSLVLLQRMPNAQLHVFPNCGHWAHREKQAEFDALVTTFLAG